MKKSQLRKENKSQKERAHSGGEELAGTDDAGRLTKAQASTSSVISYERMRQKKETNLNNCTTRAIDNGAPHDMPKRNMWLLSRHCPLDTPGQSLPSLYKMSSNPLIHAGGHPTRQGLHISEGMKGKRFSIGQV